MRLAGILSVPQAFARQGRFLSEPRQTEHRCRYQNRRLMCLRLLPSGTSVQMQVRDHAGSCAGGRRWYAWSLASGMNQTTACQMSVRPTQANFAEGQSGLQFVSNSSLEQWGREAAVRRVSHKRRQHAGSDFEKNDMIRWNRLARTAAISSRKMHGQMFCSAFRQRWEALRSHEP